MTKKKRPEQSIDSKQLILNAAIIEFAEHGRDGVRMEGVAQRAGVNKSLVYRHFKNRENLFEAAFESVFAERFKLLEDLPEQLEDLFELWTKRFADNPLFVQMILRESLEMDTSTPIQAELRQQYYKNQIESIKNFQQQEKLPGEMDPECLFLMLTAVLVFPFLLPQVTQLITGHAPDSTSFQTRWKHQFNQLAQRLA